MIDADKQILQKIADTVRVLSADGVEKAGCGHPGLPLGCAEIGAVLYGKHLRFNPANPDWMGRDRFVLSAGHGSMFLYSLLHLSGYDLSLDDVKNFRQKHSKTPGHPEFGEAPGVETTTGPLGQGIAAATGMAMAQKIAAAQFGEELFDSKVYVLAGDGCMMEGISGEAGSLAGHLGLNNLVIIYDSNNICLDGPLEESMSEDTAKRYESYGFKVLTINGNDLSEIETALTDARNESARPVLIIAKTIIGKGAPSKQGTSSCHGSKLGAEEIVGMKKALGWPEEPFYIPAEVTEYFAGRQSVGASYETDWNAKLEAMKADPAKAALWETVVTRALPETFDDELYALEIPEGKAGRQQSQACLNWIAQKLPYFVSGSADLSCSDSTAVKGSGAVSKGDWSQKNIKFGVREFSMATACYGMALQGMVQPLCGTFLTFSDYMRNAIRVAALMKQRVFFQFTHDSVWLGEDGPTHQPVEHVAALRAMPNVTVFRPCDENETKAAWIQAFKAEGPVTFILSRQGLKSQPASKAKAREGVAKGAYVLHGEPGAKVDVMICATGSEIPTAMEVTKLLEEQGKTVRVVSMPCWELFDKQDKAYKNSVLGGDVSLKVSIEALTTMGWHKYVGADGLTIGIDTFGASAPLKDLIDMFGFAPEVIVNQINEALPASV